MRVFEHGAALAVFIAGESWRSRRSIRWRRHWRRCDRRPVDGADAGPGRAAAGRGRRPVRQGQPLMVVEAMKMEHTIAAPRDGTVAAVHYAPGDLVEEGAELIALADRADGPADDSG